MYAVIYDKNFVGGKGFGAKLPDIKGSRTYERAGRRQCEWRSD